MKNINVDTATNQQLDWLVAKTLGHTTKFNMKSMGLIWYGWWMVTEDGYEELLKYSTDWAQSGPIIERERMLIQPELFKEGCANAWNAISMYDAEACGPTPLIAAMRCFVKSKLGNTVEIPEELV